MKKIIVSLFLVTIAPLSFAQTSQNEGVCIYESKSYGEGAVIVVADKTSLTCVERSWDRKIASISADNKRPPRDLVWEPTNSPRIPPSRKMNDASNSK